MCYEDGVWDVETLLSNSEMPKEDHNMGFRQCEGKLSITVYLLHLTIYFNLIYFVFAFV